MLLRLLVLCGLFWAGMQVAYGDDLLVEEPPAPVNDPQGFGEKLKGVINYLNPGAETLYDIPSHQWYTGVSASLWNIHPWDVYLASLRLGYAGDTEFFGDAQHELLYGSLKLDLPGLISLVTPDHLERSMSDDFSGWLVEALGKYGSVGFYGGRDIVAEDTAYGATFGVAMRF